MTHTEVDFLRKGIAAAQAGDHLSARFLLQKAIELDPDNEVGWLWMAHLAESKQQAISHLRRALEINPESDQVLATLSKTLLNFGVALAKEGSKSQSRVLLLEASSLNPDNEQVWLWLASVSDGPADALRYVQKTLEINPHNQQAIAWLNKLQAQNNAAKPAWQCPFCATNSQEKQTVCPSCHGILTLGNLSAFAENKQVDRKLLTEAIERYQKLAGNNGDFSTQFYLGLAHLNLNQLSEAITCLQKASELRPGVQALKTHLVALEQLQKAEAERLKQERRKDSLTKTILVIDDSATVRKLVQVTLERCGHQVLMASGMMEALTQIEESAPDLVLLDIILPRLDGYQLCKTIKRYDSTKNVPVVMLSGKDGFFDKVRGRMAGAVGYITKPFEPAVLIKAIETYCPPNSSR